MSTYINTSKHNQNTRNHEKKSKPIRAFSNSITYHKDVHCLHHRAYTDE